MLHKKSRSIKARIQENVFIRMKVYMLTFGLLMGVIFPVYAQFFVNWVEHLFVWFVLGCIAAGVVVGLFNHWIVSITVKQHLTRLNESLYELTEGSGDLSIRLDSHSKDEFGSIAKSFNQFVEIIQSIVVSTHKLIGDTPCGGASSSNTQGLVQVEESLKNMALQAKKKTELVEKTAKAIQDIESKMETCIEYTSQMVQAIAEINRSNKDVSSIVSHIDSIAFHTKLLALNASVEAARVGEQGLGFQAVAKEVQALAQKSSESVEQTTSIIASTVVQNKKGEELALKTAEALKDVAQKIDIATSDFQKINAATQDQTKSILSVEESTRDFACFLTEVETRLKQFQA